MLTGTYTGDASDNRVINIGVDLAAMDDAVVMIFGASQNKRLRIEAGQGDSAEQFNSSPAGAGIIKSFTSVGFTLGTNNHSNGSGIAYQWIAYWSNDP